MFGSFEDVPKRKVQCNKLNFFYLVIPEWVDKAGASNIKRFCQQSKQLSICSRQSLVEGK